MLENAHRENDGIPACRPVAPGLLVGPMATPDVPEGGMSAVPVARPTLLAEASIAVARIMRILVIDDDPNLCAAMAQHLESLGGVMVVPVTNTDEAEAWLTHNHADLMLVDHITLGTGVVDWIERVRHDRPAHDVPMLMITAEDDKALLLTALEAGANDFVRKPIEPAELIARARNMLKLRAQTVSLLEAYAQLKELATTDSLTKISNRGAFFDRLNEEIRRARRHGHVLSVIMLDIDRFKSVNDDYGHAGGDRVLVELASICRSILRASDFIGRLGGEEFALGLPHAPLEGAHILADRVRVRVEHTVIKVAMHDVSVTISLGVAELQPGDVDVDALLHRADLALYEAKRSGRNRVCIAN